MSTIRRLIFILCGLIVSTATSQANVSLKNGNFFMGYTDVVYPGGFEPKMERVYNSKTSYRGIYGWGWGTEYEAYLAVGGDGTILVHEYGGGAENVFVPETADLGRIDREIDQIMRAAEEVREVTSTAESSQLRQRLRSDASFRESEWIDYLDKRMVHPSDVPIGTRYMSNRFSHQVLARVRDGYERLFDNGRIEEFDLDGHLIGIKDRNNNFIRLTYDARGKLESITDNFGRRMGITINDRGLIEHIDCEGGREVVLHYNDLDELIYSKDVDGNVYRFEYSGDQRHNMVKISYTDATTMEMSYYGQESMSHEGVKTVKDRDGTLSAYAYTFDEKDGGHYAIDVIVMSPRDKSPADSNSKVEDKSPAIKIAEDYFAAKGAHGQLISSSHYEYFMETTSNGQEWTRRMITIQDGDKTDTEYDPRFGLPSAIRHGKEQQRFEYDALGHVTRKDTPMELTELKYDPAAGKVSYVHRKSKTTKNDESWSKFSYDARGNLIYAENSKKKAVWLHYDEHGRISELTDKTKLRILFTYNRNSKPVEIQSVWPDGTTDKITVTYTPDGEIQKVDSDSGRKVALQVTTAFQNLLDIIRPAGVNIGF